jgi:hypothetical protein
VKLRRAYKDLSIARYKFQKEFALLFSFISFVVEYSVVFIGLTGKSVEPIK